MGLGAFPFGGRNPNRKAAKESVGMKNVAGGGPSSYGGRLGDQRRLSGLCYRSGDKYFPGHQCKRQILLLEGDEEGVHEIKEGTEEEKYEEEHDGEISIHALKGVPNNKIIKVEGKVKNCSLKILIDSGSTHIFLNEGMAGKLKCKLANT